MEPGNLSFCNDKIMNTLDHQSIQSIFNFPKRSTLRQDLSKLCLVKCDVSNWHCRRREKSQNKQAKQQGSNWMRPWRIYTYSIRKSIKCCKWSKTSIFLYKCNTIQRWKEEEDYSILGCVCVCARRSIVLKGFSPYMVILLSISSCCRVYVSYDRPRRKCDR